MCGTTFWQGLLTPGEKMCKYIYLLSLILFWLKFFSFHKKKPELLVKVLTVNRRLGNNRRLKLEEAGGTGVIIEMTYHF